MTSEHLFDQPWDQPHPQSDAVLRDLAPGPDERKIDKRYRGAYEDPDVAPKLEYDAQGNLLLHIEPRSIQAELMVRANTIVAEKKVKELEEGDIPGDKARDLQAEVKNLEALTARLRGYRPYNPERVLPQKPNVRERIGQAMLDLSNSGVTAQSARPAETYTAPEGVATGSTFTNTDAMLLLHNLSLAAHDLRMQAQRGDVPNPAAVKNTAEDMTTLRAGTFERMFELQDGAPLPPIYPY